MSDVKKPMAGEWWEFTDGFRLFVVGRKLNGSLLCQTDCGAIEVYSVGGDEWKHLPDCNGWHWKPEVFPQYWTIIGTNIFTEHGFIRVDSPTRLSIVRKCGIEDVQNHSGLCRKRMLHEGRTELTKEQAEALPLPKESPDDWVIQDRVPARAGVDERRFTTPSGHVQSWGEVKESWSAGMMHGEKKAGEKIEVRCRRKYLPYDRTITIIRWLCWNEDGKERIVQAANRPTGFLNCVNVGEEKFEVSL